MQFTKFGQTGLTVSRMILGTGTFGKQTDEKEAHRMLAFAQVSKFFDCNSGMSRSRQTLAGSRIADFTLKLIWAPEQPIICPARKLPRYATFRQIKGPR